MIPTNAVWFCVRLSGQDTSGAWFMPETEEIVNKPCLYIVFVDRE